jgi:hypothetical protein
VVWGHPSASVVNSVVPRRLILDCLASRRSCMRARRAIDVGSGGMSPGFGGSVSAGIGGPPGLRLSSQSSICHAEKYRRPFMMHGVGKPSSGWQVHRKMVRVVVPTRLAVLAFVRRVSKT